AESRRRLSRPCAVYPFRRGGCPMNRGSWRFVFFALFLVITVTGPRIPGGGFRGMGCRGAPTVPTFKPPTTPSFKAELKVPKWEPHNIPKWEPQRLPTWEPSQELPGRPFQGARDLEMVPGEGAGKGWPTAEGMPGNTDAGKLHIPLPESPGWGTRWIPQES